MSKQLQSIATALERQIIQTQQEKDKLQQEFSERLFHIHRELSDTSIQFQFLGELDVDAPEDMVVEPDDAVVVLGGHVGGIPIVNRGQVARRGRRSGGSRPFVSDTWRRRLEGPKLEMRSPVRGEVVGRAAIGDADVVDGAEAVGVAGRAEMLVEFGWDEVDGRVVVGEVVEVAGGGEVGEAVDVAGLVEVDAAVEVGGCSENGEVVVVAGGGEFGELVVVAGGGEFGELVVVVGGGEFGDVVGRGEVDEAVDVAGLVDVDAAIKVGGGSEHGEAVGAVEMAGGAAVGATGRAEVAGRTEATGWADSAGRTEATGRAEAGTGTVNTCPACGRAFRSRSATSQHFPTHEERRRCPGCPVSFATNNSLGKHRRRYGH
ncbi:unnamed protein product [Allacma fusca]|uniref:C2H2-type domain-containing protein n=1 Tax=Allacma fusca TaxID=39272 RepID=A0A8J2NRM6_9HEXA|nr:unnamed protein product [Allacma fusca]